MAPKLYYAPVSEAIEKLRKAGFAADFSLNGDKIDVNGKDTPVTHFEVQCIYRYEGHSDPGDEAVVYGLQSDDGMRGILVAGYGPSSEDISYDASTGKLKG